MFKLIVLSTLATFTSVGAPPSQSATTAQTASGDVAPVAMIPDQNAMECIKLRISINANIGEWLHLTGAASQAALNGNMSEWAENSFDAEDVGREIKQQLVEEAEKCD